jgi:CheY-like chemotaxis protein
MSDSTGNSGAVKKRVLVVDDTEHVAELIREMLLSFGHEPEVCLSPHEGLEKFKPGKFNLVITDYTMPRMNGIEFSRELRALAPEQPILLITGSTGSHGVEGPPGSVPYNATLEKPFSIMEFQQVVDRLLATAQTVA